MALVSFIRRLTLFYFSDISFLYSVVLTFHMHELCMCFSYVLMLDLYTHLIVVYP